MNVFNKIAPLYGRFFDYQEKYFAKIIEKVRPEFDISQYESVLDVGCGTGAFLSVVEDMGLKTSGADSSEAMIKQARKKLKGKNTDLTLVKAGEKLPFRDKSFDIVFASYVAHGLSPEERIGLYREMRRMAREYVIIHDYNDKRAIHTSIIEWLERGDYFNFIRVAEGEVAMVFPSVKKINVDKRAAWYICRVK